MRASPCGGEGKGQGKKPKKKAKKAEENTPLGIKLEGTQNTQERVEKLRAFAWHTCCV